jgi:hypothetical protein
MKQIVCDMCDTPIIKNNTRQLIIKTDVKDYNDICKHCADQIINVIDEIENRPIAICKECGR